MKISNINNQKYIVYKGTGGLFHNLGGLSTAIEIAKKTNRILIIDMFLHIQINGKYKINFEDFFIIDDNTFEHYNNYDILPKDIMCGNWCLDEIIKIGANKMNGSHYLYNDYNLSVINHNDQIVIFSSYGSTINHNIVVNPRVCNKLKEEEIISDQYISVHFRGTDRWRGDINQFIDCARNIIHKTGIKILYIATDDNLAFDIFQKKITDVQIIRKTHPDNSKVGGIHYSSTDKHKQIYECLKDIYYILHSEYFIPSTHSAYSKGIFKMIVDKKPIFPNIISNTEIIYVPGATLKNKWSFDTRGK